ncbi:MAG: MFS transporter [Desulfurococcales archaeon ex4484_58]|nr:MAG: MFS transporter [Desulfurococcales archaeon ex4484_58]
MKIIDKRSFYTSMISVVYVMVLSGIVTPHISLSVLEEAGLFWVSLLTLGFMIARSTASLIHAPLYQRYSARIVGGIGLGLLITSYYLYSIVSPIYYPLLQLITGFSSGLFWPLMQSLLAHGLNPNWRSRGFSIYFMVGAIAGYMGYQLGSLIYVYLGPENLYVVAYIAGYLYLAIYLLISPSSRLAVKSRGKIKYSLLRGFREVSSLLPLIIFLGGVNGLLKDYLIAYVKLLTGYDEPTIRHFWSIAGYIGLVIGYIASHIQEKYHMDRQVLVFGSLMISSIILLPFITSPYIVFLIIAFVMVGTRILRPIIRGIASNKTRHPETGIAIVNSLSNISAGLSPLIIAMLSSIL